MDPTCRDFALKIKIRFFLNIRKRFDDPGWQWIGWANCPLTVSEPLDLPNQAYIVWNSRFLSIVIQLTEKENPIGD